ncbi:unnamed protein product [Didymodactylos carnosus]|uniref:RNA helicase n=1 Tax=Didymodactylos carnosus TaxID=1234261 RepID=A0A813UK23_9BILA|nr:unnamed protein product [Didymodactylos carnosus]CAF1077492.1 unnamed protein product [Didymodactylos carnosus]CAF3611174.1 unnamed protein product [Didymodactylos carnosus]CAF3841039.1 unnamed protein product [Didymodactylos carnosus]
MNLDVKPAINNNLINSNKNENYDDAVIERENFPQPTDDNNTVDNTTNDVKSLMLDNQTSANQQQQNDNDNDKKTNEPLDETAQYYRDFNIRVENGGDIKPWLEFSDTNFPEEILKIFEENEYDIPTPIQSLAWPVLQQGRDIVGIASTGSGKTLGFIIPMLLHVRKQPPLQPDDGPLAVVLAPTRELVQQISQVSKPYFDLFNIKSSCIIGGDEREKQISEIGEGREVYICTPGRLLDFLEHRITTLYRVTYIVLDEADKMFDLGFESQVRQILNDFKSTNSDEQTRQMCMFSATWPKTIKVLAEDYLKDYVHVTIGCLTEYSVNLNIQQIVQICNEQQKRQQLFNTLRDIGQEEEHKCIIFVRTREKVNRLNKELEQQGYKALLLHGSKSQQIRNEVFKEFRETPNALLLATDVASRGLDVDDVRFVINFDYPNTDDVYIHRIGRTGRSSKFGTAFTFFQREDGKHACALIKILDEAKQTVHPILLQIGRQNGYNQWVQNVKVPQYQPHSRMNNSSDYNQDQYGNNNFNNRQRGGPPPSLMELFPDDSGQGSVTRYPRNNQNMNPTPSDEPNQISTLQAPAVLPPALMSIDFSNFDPSVIKPLSDDQVLASTSTINNNNTPDLTNELDRIASSNYNDGLNNNNNSNTGGGGFNNDRGGRGGFNRNNRGSDDRGRGRGGGQKRGVGRQDRQTSNFDWNNQQDQPRKRRWDGGQQNQQQPSHNQNNQITNYQMAQNSQWSKDSNSQQQPQPNNQWSQQQQQQQQQTQQTTQENPGVVYARASQEYAQQYQQYTTALNQAMVAQQQGQPISSQQQQYLINFQQQLQVKQQNLQQLQLAAAQHAALANTAANPYQNQSYQPYAQQIANAWQQQQQQQQQQTPSAVPPPLPPSDSKQPAASTPAATNAYDASTWMQQWLQAGYTPDQIQQYQQWYASQMQQQNLAAAAQQQQTTGKVDPSLQTYGMLNPSTNYMTQTGVTPSTQGYSQTAGQTGTNYSQQGAAFAAYNGRTT